MDFDRPMLLRHDNTLFMSQCRRPVDVVRVTGDEVYEAQAYTDKLEAECKRLQSIVDTLRKASNHEYEKAMGSPYQGTEAAPTLD